MQISLAARLAYDLELDGLYANFGADIGEYYTNEEISYLAGWLGDATLLGTTSQTTDLENDDYCADLDAENIYRYIISGKSSINALNNYYKNINSYTNRAKIFLSYISYDYVQERIFYELIDKELKNSILCAEKDNNFILINQYLKLIQNEQYHLETIKLQYNDTYNFLMSLKNELENLSEYN